MTRPATVATDVPQLFVDDAIVAAKRAGDGEVLESQHDAADQGPTPQMNAARFWPRTSAHKLRSAGPDAAQHNTTDTSTRRVDLLRLQRLG